MIRATHGIIQSQQGGAAASFTSDFIAFTGIADAGIISDLQTMEADMTAQGWLTYPTHPKFHALWVYVGGTDATHKINFLNPQDTDAANRIVFSGAWVHSANGSQGNGATTYGDTKFSAVNFDPQDFSYGFYSRTNAITVNQGDISAEDAGFNGISILPKWSDNNTYWSACDFVVTGAGNLLTDTLAFISVSRIGNTKKLFQRGIVKATAATAALSNVNHNVVIGARNINNAPQFFSSKQRCFDYLGKGFSDPEMATLSTIVQNFQTGRGRAV